MHDKLVHLETYLREHAPLLIAYSGGVDSAFLLSVAHGTLG
jgi:PP-loop superfamily ATP-utilizing enzyme